jgi:cyanate permease
VLRLRRLQCSPLDSHLSGGPLLDLKSFLLISALLSLTTAGSSPLSFTRLVVASFDCHRGLALGTVLAGTGAGAVLVPRLLTPFVAQHGWRAGYFGSGRDCSGLVSTTRLASNALKCLRRSKHLNAIPLRDLVANPIARLLGCMFFLAAVAILGTVVQFVPMLTDWGMTPARAGATASLIGIAAIGGRLITGALLDRFPPNRVTMGLLLTAALGLGVLGIGGVARAVFGAAVLGFSVGAEANLIAFLVGRYFERAVYSQVYGAIYAAFLVGGSIGPVLSGYLQDLSGDYRLSLVVMAGLLALSALMTTRMPRIPAPGPTAP